LVGGGAIGGWPLGVGPGAGGSTAVVVLLCVSCPPPPHAASPASVAVTKARRVKLSAVAVVEVVAVVGEGTAKTRLGRRLQRGDDRNDTGYSTKRSML
jgi:hypothetical protein